MLNESQNNLSYWKNKLETLDSLQEETFDKAAAWEKLDERLNEKHPGKKAAWYWAAAACLVLAFFTTRLLRINREIPMLKNDIQAKSKIKFSTDTSFTNSAVAISQLARAQKRPIITDKVKNKKKEVSLTNKIAVDELVVIDTDAKVLLEQENNRSYKPDTIAIVAALPVKKKLQVVHINELEKPMEEPTPFVRNSVIPVFQREPVNGNVFSRFVISRNSSDDILKIKLSPSN